MRVWAILDVASDIAFAIGTIALSIRFLRAHRHEKAQTVTSDVSEQRMHRARASIAFALAGFQGPAIVWTFLLSAIAKLAAIGVPALCAWLTPP